MSVRFETWVIPEAARFDFRPSEGVTAEIVDLLAKQKWTDPTARCELRDLDTYSRLRTVDYASLGHVCGELANGGQSFSVELSSTPWPPAGGVIEDLDGVTDFSKAHDLLLLPTHGVEVTLVLAPMLRLLPADMNGSMIPCPDCDKDIMDAEHQRLGQIAFAAPTHCPHCATALAHRNLTGETTSATNESAEEDAPFFRVALCLEPARRPAREGFVTVDPFLIDRLKELTGVCFRSMDRWR